MTLVVTLKTDHFRILIQRENPARATELDTEVEFGPTTRLYVFEMYKSKVKVRGSKLALTYRNACRWVAGQEIPWKFLGNLCQTRIRS